MLLARGRSLEDHAQLIRAARGRGVSTREALVAMFSGVTAAIVREFEAGQLLFRLLPEDVVYDPELQAYAVAADVPRHSTKGPPPAVTLLDNGIYAPETTGQLNRPISERTMVHNLAALLYYASTGLAPVPGFLGTAASDLPPMRTFEPDLPLGLDPLVRQAVARDPAERFANPAALATALAAIVAHDCERRGQKPLDDLLIHFGAATHTGLQKAEKNPNNQDHHLCVYDQELRLGLFVVADGVSNCRYGSGERAALRTVQAAQAVWEEMVDDFSPEIPPQERDEHMLRARLGRIFERANRLVVEEIDGEYPGRLDAGAQIMSSTATALLANGSRALIGNLGDSRVYLVRSGLIDQLTVDLDRRTTLLREGKGLDAIMNASGLGELTGNIGRFNVGPSGHLVPAAVVPEIGALNLMPGDRLLVCSDGVPDCIGLGAEARIREITTRAKRPAQAAWEFIVAANDNGGKDNITAVVVDCTTKEYTP